VAVGLQLGIKQPAIGAHLEAPPLGGRQAERFDLRLKLFEQLDRQTGGAIGVMSDSAVNDLDF